MARLTKAMRREILNAGPFHVEDGAEFGSPGRRVLCGPGPVPYAVLEEPDTDDPRIDIAAALNSVASEPESVAVTREALLSACTAKAFHSGEVVVAAINYSWAHHAAKRARK